MRGAVRLLRSRNFILTLALITGFAVGEGAGRAEGLLVPALALVMTLATTTITTRDLIGLRDRPGTILSSLLLSYLVMGGSILLLGWWLVEDSDLWAGLVVLAAVPPAVAVVPFSYLLGADTRFSLAGLIATYLLALAIMPGLLVLFLDVDFLDPVRLLVILGQLVVLPLVLSRVLLVSGLGRRMERWRGPVINWCFFLVVFTIIGINREVLLTNPEASVRIAIIAVATNFALGYGIEYAARLLGMDRRTGISWLLFGTKKNYGLASVIALTLLGKTAAIPGAVFVVFATLHFVWLGFHLRKPAEVAGQAAG